ncbi:MAG: ABC transporter ATP-binding protein [bacterium]
MSTRTIIRAENLYHEYRQADSVLRVLKDVSLSVKESEIIAFVGPSGSGKSTLLHILGLMEKPSSGNLFLFDNDVSSLEDNERSILRNKTIGFLFQFHYLLPEFTLFENVMIPTMINREKPRLAKQRVMHLLDALGISKRSHHFPSELSGGEQQRAALARALINHPRIILADEPTGNLDKERAIENQELLWSQCEHSGATLIVVTHNDWLASKAHRKLRLDDGKIFSS